MKNEIEELVCKWQADNVVRNLSKESIETYKSSIKDVLVFLTSKRVAKIKKINDTLVKEYIVEQIKRGCSARTINNRLKAFRRLLSFYKTEYNAAYTLPAFKMQREECTARGPLTNEEVYALIKNFSPEDADSVLVAFILDTGVRSKSVRNVRVEDLDLDNGNVTIKVTKNKQPIVLPLSEALRELLRKYIKKTQGKPGFLFPNSTNGKMYDRSSVYKRVNRYLKRCGVEKSGVHLFRYTFGRIMVENNCNAMILQKWFGHHSLDETNKYVRLYSNELKQVCEQVTPLSKYGKIFKNFAFFH